MPSLVWIMPDEAGVVSTNGGGLWSTIANAPTCSTDYHHGGGKYSMKFSPSATTCYVRQTANVASSSVLVLRLYFLIHSWAAVNHEIFTGVMAAGSSLRLTIDVTNKNLFCSFGTSGGKQTWSQVLSLDTWYRVEFKADLSANPNICDWQCAAGDAAGSAQTQVSFAQAATTFSSIQPGTNTAITATFYLDDGCASLTTGNYPIGAGEIDPLYPSAAGTSNPGSYIQDNGSAVVNDSSNPANVELKDDPLTDTTTFIKQTGNDVNLYAEVNFDDTSLSSVNGASAILAYYSAATQANNGQTLIVTEPGNYYTVYSGDMSESSLFYKAGNGIVTAPSGGWSIAKVNALLGQVGYSSDVAPIPYWCSLMIIVDGVASAGPTNIVGAEATQAQLMDAAGLAPIYNLTGAEATQAQLMDTAAVAILITGGEATQAQLMDAAPITAKTNLTGAEASQAQLSDAASLTAITNLTGAEASQSQIADNAPVSAVTNITAGEASQSQVMDTASLSQATNITGGEATQAQIADAASLTAIYLIVGTEASQSQVMDAASLAPQGYTNLTGTEAVQAQSMDAPDLSAIYLLSGTEASQSQIADAANLTFSGIEITNVTGTEAFQSQVMDAPGLGVLYNLMGNEAYQAQAIDPAIVSLFALVTHGNRTLYKVGTRGIGTTGHRMTAHEGERETYQVDKRKKAEV